MKRVTLAIAAILTLAASAYGQGAPASKNDITVIPVKLHPQAIQSPLLKYWSI